MQLWRLTSLKVCRLTQQAGDPGELVVACQGQSDSLGTWRTIDVCVLADGLQAQEEHMFPFNSEDRKKLAS